MKKLVKIIVPILVLAIVGTGTKVYLDSRKEEGFKDVEIIIEIDNDVIFEDNVSGDFEYVGDVLDKLVEDNKVEIDFEGEKDSEFGRFISGINEFKTLDMTKGPWWVYESPNNKLVLEAGFPEGIDLQIVFDGDTFIFNLLD